MFVYLNMNPELKETFDCVIRAVSFVLGLDWDTTFLYILVIISHGEGGGHVVAVEDGNYYDIWDSGDEVPTYYWMKA